MKRSEESIEMNKEFYEEVKKQLKSLFSDFYPSSFQYRAYIQAQKQIFERLGRQDAIMKAFTESVPMWMSAVESKVFPIRYFCLRNAMSYLFSVEVSGNFYVNLALLLLVGKGYMLHLDPDRKYRFIRHATSLKDIESPSLSLSRKLNFLEANGLRFFKKWIKTTLRNKIAHADFEIEANGKFFLIDEKGKRKKVDLPQELLSFTNQHTAVANAFGEYIFGKDWKTTEPPSQNKK